MMSTQWWTGWCLALMVRIVTWGGGGGGLSEFALTGTGINLI